MDRILKRGQKSRKKEKEMALLAKSNTEVSRNIRKDMKMAGWRGRQNDFSYVEKAMSSFFWGPFFLLVI